jgi:hypothetical protein
LSIRDKRNSFYDQLGTIGGTLGLFTGMSLLSMVEVIFLMGNIFKQAKAKYYARKYGKRLEFFLPKTQQEIEEIARKKKVKQLESDLVVSIKHNFTILERVHGVPHLRGFHYRGFHYRNFWLMYIQVGDFRVCRGPPTVPLMQISRNAVFFQVQKSA